MGPGSTPFIMGQMMTPSGTTAQPMIIQQPSGGPMFVLRPNVPLQTASTIVPIAAAQPGLPSQLILQQGQPRGILANQQVKLVSQNQMQMQQIQTPSGPKLIAVPIGQTLIPGQNLIATSSSGGVQIAQGISSSGQIQIQTAVPATPQMSIASSTIIPTVSPGLSLQANTSNNPNIVTSLPLGMKTTSVLHQSSGGTVTTMINSPNQPLQVATGNIISTNTVIQQKLLDSNS